MVDGVVVHQRRQVDELDDGREGQSVLVLLPVGSAREQKEGRTEELPAHEEEVLVDLFDLVEVGGRTDLRVGCVEQRCHRLAKEGVEPTSAGGEAVSKCAVDGATENVGELVAELDQAIIMDEFL